MKKQDEIEELDVQIEQALAVLNNRQKKFVLTLGEGNETQTGAAIKAGYSENRARQTGNRLVTKGHITRAISLLSKKHQLDHGIAASEKRRRLLEIADTARQPGDDYQPSAAVSSLRLLAELDGDIRSTGGSGSNVTINVITGVTTDDEKVIDHE